MQSLVPYRNLSALALAGGALLLALALCALGTFILIPLFQKTETLATNTAVLSLGAVALCFGALLIWFGRNVRASVAVPLRLPSPFLFLAAFFLALILGQTVLSLRAAPAYLFPFFHVLASLTFPLTILAFAARRLQCVSLTSMLAQFSWGGLVTITLAVVLELLVGGFMVIVALVALVVVLGSERIQEIADALQSASLDTQRVLEIISAEPLAVLIVGFSALVLFVILAPLLEEMIKASGSAILIARRVRAHAAPTKSEALLWGLAAGAGYAFTENMFNGQNSLGAAGVGSLWATAMILRAGTSLMHMLATATVAVGWYEALVLKKRARVVLFFAAALTAHAVWNTGAVLLGGVSVLNALAPDMPLLAVLLVGGALAFLGILFGAFLFWLWRLVRWAQPTPVEIITSPNLGGLPQEQFKQI